MSARHNWIRPVAMCCAPILAIGVIALGYAMFFERRFRCCLHVTPHGRAQADIVTIFSATMEFSMNHDGHFPTTLDELVEPDALGYRYLNQKSRPQDPWGHSYIYVPPTGNEPEPNVITFGADGQLGGTGEDADIDSRTMLREPGSR